MTLKADGPDVIVVSLSRVVREGYSATDFGEARRVPGRHGYVAYFPKPIPRRLELSDGVIAALADAEAALGELAGLGRLLPNPDLLIRPYLLREALSSTRIEGTQASMVEVLVADASGETPTPDVEEVINYVFAMRRGLERLESLPLSVRLLKQIHGELMMGVRGQNLEPGELRRTQNWIGPAGSTIESAPFVPPPPEQLGMLLSDWERFANEDPPLPLLIQDAMLHSQFETIHPFLDGNGRLGRLIIVFFLVARGRLPAPLLYMSAYLEQNREQYYASLQRIREAGDPLPWLELFLTAVRTQALDALARARRILDVRESYRTKTASLASVHAHGLIEIACITPVVTAKAVEERLGTTRPTALRLLKKFEELGVLTEAKEGARGQRRYVASEMMDAVSQGT